MPAQDKTKLVKIQRGRYSPRFQVARAMMSAASAVMLDDPKTAKRYISQAIVELQLVHGDLGGTR